MIHVRYPEPQFRIKNENGRKYIFDSIRKVWLLLTEEEWVRQNFVRYLVDALNYPSTVIALEKEILLNDLKKRFDILVYNKEHKPWMLVECKSSLLLLSQEVLYQVLRYNISVPAEYLIITNGTTTMAWKKAAGQLQQLNEMPEWESY
ncbi:MAG: type I restriction enzyme HsdR N-terminal domain-containing protein [Chitinophagaceae bacterium]|nr:type I restriction enzyme HsdR N-terminal domain-containing protein [Chitinophagaceae bacterium]